MYKSWKGRLGPSEESWLTSLRFWNRILVEVVAVGSRRRNRDFHHGATRGCASGNKEIQTRQIREIDEIEHEHGRFMQTRREEDSISCGNANCRGRGRKVGKRKKRVKRGGNRERKTDLSERVKVPLTAGPETSVCVCECVRTRGWALLCESPVPVAERPMRNVHSSTVPRSRRVLRCTWALLSTLSHLESNSRPLSLSVNLGRRKTWGPWGPWVRLHVEGYRGINPDSETLPVVLSGNFLVFRAGRIRPFEMNGLVGPVCPLAEKQSGERFSTTAPTVRNLKTTHDRALLVVRCHFGLRR